KNLTVMSTLARKTWYPNPEPDGFYSGNTEAESFTGLPENYYAFTWGDALYVSIDPYRYSVAGPDTDSDGWDWSLGKTQYDWFRKTLEDSTAKYKFVFAHHAIGNFRGGAEIAGLYEWGGYDRNGSYQFDKQRPGWGKPIQQIMKDTGVTIFFQGHDHLFAREVVDGVVYQTLPKPAERIADKQSNYDAYPDADVLMNSGFLKVDVTSEAVQVDYFRNYFVASGSQEDNTGIVYSYTVDEDHNVKVLKKTVDDTDTYGGNSSGLTTDSGVKDGVSAGTSVKTGTTGKTGTKTAGSNQKAAASSRIKVNIDGEKLVSEVSPFLDSAGRIQIPARVISEKLGCEVLWEEGGEKGTVTIKKADTVIVLEIGSSMALVNGKSIKLDTAPVIRDGSTYIPLRFVSEALGAAVEWDGTRNTVKITSAAAKASTAAAKVSTAAAKAATTATTKATTKATTATTTATATTAAASKSAKGVVLGAPTDTSVDIKAIAASDAMVYAEYGLKEDVLTRKTGSIAFKTGEVLETVISGLNPDAKYYYRLMASGNTGESPVTLGTGSFHTARNEGESFTFTLQADSHRDENSDLELYEAALANIKADVPDFHIDLGDTFMGEKLASTEAGTLQRYLEDRSYFSQIASSVPLFLVNGNHEGENGWNMKNGNNNIAMWASAFRLKYFPNPSPEGFFSGSSAGKGNYYSFTWGEAQFIMLDPYWFSAQKAVGDDDGWNYTLGKTQYDWLKKTLESSSSKYKFVFTHNLVGGVGKDSRGGAEAAAYYEWGGNNSDGSYGFDKIRPGWGEPIHQMLVENKVNAVFHGHDHFYAKQELDGITYQLVPQPSHPGSDVKNATEYSYVKGTFLPPAGHLRISVSAASTLVEYVSASTDSNINGKIAASYNLYGK
ncbi:MAG: hypothetical protein HGA22_06420, partial [Clostridiales bacterium]|nr:hypothetical protein [Clostridiales bacterium]